MPFFMASSKSNFFMIICSLEYIKTKSTLNSLWGKEGERYYMRSSLFKSSIYYLIYEKLRLPILVVFQLITSQWLRGQSQISDVNAANFCFDFAYTSNQKNLSNSALTSRKDEYVKQIYQNLYFLVTSGRIFYQRKIVYHLDFLLFC